MKTLLELSEIYEDNQASIKQSVTSENTKPKVHEIIKEIEQLVRDKTKVQQEENNELNIVRKKPKNSLEKKDKQLENIRKSVEKFEKELIDLKTSRKEIEIRIEQIIRILTLISNQMEAN